jgi:hypothetical protein
MGYLAVWKVQEEMIADLRKRGVAIPEKTMNDLKTARTLIKIPKTETSPEDTTPDIEIHLTNIESFIITEAEKHLGPKCADEWLRKLDKASKATDEPEDKTRFVPGIPRGQKWVRIKPTDELPLETLKTMANGFKLNHKAQQDGHLLVYGEDKPLKDFIAKMTAKQSSKKP